MRLISKLLAGGPTPPGQALGVSAPVPVNVDVIYKPDAAWLRT